MTKRQSTDSYDIIVSGGGVAGLAGAAIFGSAGFSVLCVDPSPPVTTDSDPTSDLRTTAFLQPARELLERCGLWDRFSPYAASLQIMRIVDAGGEAPEARIIKDFNASEISEQPFGWNLPNWLLRREILAHFDDLPNVEFRPGIGTASVLTREREAIVTLSDASRATSRLLIAADGRNSSVREAVGIGVKTTRYGQKALAFAVTHPNAHDNISTEIHRSGGPFTLVPLPDRDGAPCSAVVWMESGANVGRLAGLPVEKFETEMSVRSCHLLGPLTLVSRRSVWPIVSQIANKMSAERTALIAEAAHVVPPIGAQGLNMSLGDLRVLLELAQSDPEGLGSRAMLDQYHTRRHRDVRIRVTGIDMLNRASMIGGRGLRDLRAGALDVLYSVAPIRKSLMRTGLGMR